MIGRVDDRLERERGFHDARFAEDSEGRAADRFYAINEASDRFYRESIEAMPRGSRILDYGCGDAAYCALHAAKLGHSVVGIDISPIAIDRAGGRAEQLGLADRIEFEVMNAEQLELPDDGFDLVIGLGVIHHLDIASAMREVTRVLKPSGRAVFVEPLGHNPAINMFRARTPEQRTADEHPLVVSDFELIGRYFRSVEPRYFHLLGLLALPLRGRSFFDRAVRALDSADQALFRRVQSAGKHAWMVGLSLSSPIKDAAQPS